jgi:hypothetical protein
MDGWKTISTNHVNFELTSINMSSKCKSTLSISIINRWKNCITQNLMSITQKWEGNISKALNKNGIFT